MAWIACLAAVSLSLLDIAASAQDAALPPPPPPAPVAPPPQRTFSQPFQLPRVDLPFNILYSIWNSEAQMNDFYQDKFIRSAGFGGVRLTVPTMQIDPYYLLVIGQTMKLDGAGITAVQSYQINRLELIGIARHDPPVAFVVSRHSGFMIDDVERGTSAERKPSRFSAALTITGTRPLTVFEASALEQIKTGAAVVDQKGGDGTLQVVGIVRAQQACLQCHDNYKVGDALGAFSYHLSLANVFDQAVRK